MKKTPTTTRSAAIYVRISRDRNGDCLGVERQEQECRTLAERLGWTVTEVYSDNDISAFSGRRRPDYERRDVVRPCPLVGAPVPARRHP